MEVAAVIPTAISVHGARDDRRYLRFNRQMQTDDSEMRPYRGIARSIGFPFGEIR